MSSLILYQWSVPKIILLPLSSLVYCQWSVGTMIPYYAEQSTIRCFYIATSINLILLLKINYPLLKTHRAGINPCDTQGALNKASDGRAGKFRFNNVLA